MKIYAVKKGYKTGIFHEWSDAQEAINGYSGAQFKSFKREEDALAYLGKENNSTSNDNGTIAYIDGSYNPETKLVSYGIIFLKDNKIKNIIGECLETENVSSRNVLGELAAAIEAINLAIKKQESSITLYYDYEGIEKWATREWKAKTNITKQYVKQITELQNEIDINFCKVQAHSNIKYNELVDKIAKQCNK